MKTKRKNVIKVAITYVLVLLAIIFVGWVNNVAANTTYALGLILPIVAWWPMLAPVAFFMLRDKETPKDIGFTKAHKLMQILMGGLVAGCSLTIFIIIPALFGINMSYVGNMDILAILYQLAYMMLSVALVEEVIFRGYLFKKLFDINGSKWLAILGSSVLFGLIHIFNGNLLQVVITAAIGLYWCICRIRIKHCSLLSLIIAHALHNTIHPIIAVLFFG